MTRPDIARPDIARLDIACLGETMVMIAPQPGGHLDANSSFVLRSGGAESNVARSVAALGHTTAWLSALGDDPFASLILDELRGAGVDVAHVASSTQHPTGVYFKNPRDAITDVYYYRSGSAASHLAPAILEEWKRLSPRIVHVSGITSALSTSCLALISAVVKERVFGDSLISFDVNYRPKLWSTEHAAPILLDLARSSDIVFVGRDEAETLWQTRTAEEICEALGSPDHIVVKDGAIEATEFAAGQQVTVPAPAVDVVDVVGAGDAFAAGWLSSLLGGDGAVRRLRAGHLVASLVLRSPSDSAELPDQHTIAGLLGADPREWNSTGAGPHPPSVAHA